ncbi:LifA/Efa1-related large cytotoxin [Chlamydia suis]|uniref:Adherence factor n=1 Tax=Chlamydia suis TaxID=83559 RepID=A0ABX6ITH6_9CHLA|nr:LifA/Efa1-related large cytotoxin [Chlamydia suis]QHP83352.1 putative adherence factor [Chlamydia suis]
MSFSSPASSTVSRASTQSNQSLSNLTHHVAPAPDHQSVDLQIYDELIHNNHSTEDVVAIGRRIQQEYANLTASTQVSFSASPSHHTGNRKVSLLYNLSMLIANLFPMTIQPVRPQKIVLRSPASSKKTSEIRATRKGSSHTSLKDLLLKKPVAQRLAPVSSVKSSKTIPIRKKRSNDGLEQSTHNYDLTADNILEKLSLTPEQQIHNKDLITRLQETISQYNALKQKNSRKGQSLLTKQAKILNTILSRTKSTEERVSNSMMTTIKKEFSSHRVSIERNIHGIWIAGSPPEGTDEYIKLFLTTYPEFTFLFWVDSTAYGAAKFSSTLKRVAFDAAVNSLRNATPEPVKQFVQRYDELKKAYDASRNFEEKQKLSEQLLTLYDNYNKFSKNIQENFDVLLLHEMILIQDSFFNYCQLKGVSSITDNTRTEYLANVLKVKEEELSHYKETIKRNKENIETLVKELNDSVGKGRVVIKDIRELASLKDPTNIYNYETEMLLRWNYAAATDMLRMYMLKEYGGIYTDLDIMPQYSQEILRKIMEVGGNRFFEHDRLRRTLAFAALKLGSGKQTTVSFEDAKKVLTLPSLTMQDRKKISELFKYFETETQAKKTLFQPMEVTVIRDFMPILQRYHKWQTGWNVRGLNGLMMAHQGSAVVENVISRQRAAYDEMRALRQNVISGEFFRSLGELANVDREHIIGGYLAKNYLGGSLFFDYRQDSVTPGAVSTLGITGPDIIMDTMIDFFKTLGPLGEDFLQDGKLGKNAFLGAYKAIKSEGGETTYDWLNPLSVGANDVTPGDESTWCETRKHCAADLLLSDSVPTEEHPKGIRKEKVNLQDFSKLWGKESQEILSKEFPDLLARFNLLIETSSLDIHVLSALDRDIQSLFEKIRTDPAAAMSVFSLQLQLAEMVRGVPFPVRNQVHILPQSQTHFDANWKKTIQLYLHSHTQTEVFVWYSSTHSQIVFGKDLLAIAERVAAAKSLIPSRDQSLIKSYLKYKTQAHLGTLTELDQEDFFDLMVDIAEDLELHRQLLKIEDHIHSGVYSYAGHSLEEWLQLSQEEQKSKFLKSLKEMFQEGDEEDTQQQRKPWFEELYEKRLRDRVEEPAKQIQELIKAFQESLRVQARDIDAYFSRKPFYQKLMEAGYAFEDISTITKYLLASDGVSGIITSEPIFPPPSKQLIDAMKLSLGEDFEELHNTLQTIYEWLSKEPKSQAAEQVKQKLPQKLQEALVSYTPHDLLIPPIDGSVSALGLRFSIDNSRVSEQVLISIAPGVPNPASYAMTHYLEGLFLITKDIQRGLLTHEIVKRHLQTHSGGHFIDESKIDALLALSKQKAQISLTDTHRALTGYSSFSEASLSLLTGRIPGVSKILSREVDFGRPSATVMEGASAIRAHSYDAIGARKNFFLLPHPVPAIQAIVEQAKYTVLSWPEFYDNHADQWNDLANRFGAEHLNVHPQTFIYEAEGRCMGLALLYMLAEDSISYRLLQQNVMTASALFNEQKRLGIPLTKEDQKFLDKVLSLIEWLQFRGNQQLQTEGFFRTLDWDIPNLMKHFASSDVKSWLITTPAHSLVLSLMEDFFRVTDPNYGHADFPTLEAALSFLERMVQVSPTVSERYGFDKGKSIASQLKVHSLESSELHNTVFSPSDLGLTSRYFTTTLEEMVLRGPVTINQRLTTWATLYEMGGTILGKRIHGKTREADLVFLKINGDILNEFLTRTTLDTDLAELIQSLLKTHGLEPGTNLISPSSIAATAIDTASLLQTVKTKTSRIQTILQSLGEQISRVFKDAGVQDSDKISIDKVLLTEEANSATIDFTVINDKKLSQKKKVSIDIQSLSVSFKKFSLSMQEVVGTGVLDLELGMTVVSLVQYVRLVEAGRGKDALAIANLVMDLKAVLEVTIGNVIQALGKKLFTQAGVESFRLETELALQLRKVGTQIGGTFGKTLTHAARVLELPVLESAIGAWNLYSSVTELLHAASWSDQVAARVQVAFDSISLGITVASVISPTLMLAAGPIAAIGMGATSIARNVARTEERHAQWLKYKKFLDNGSRHTVTALPNRGLLDLSENLVLGNIVLNLRVNPPLLTGDRSYNANRWIGHKPGWSDWQIRDRLGYGYRISPTSALARGHANSFWPPTIPTLPKGRYHTIILGYGIQYKAVTEIAYLSNKVVWREAVMEPDSRYYVEPLTAEKKCAKILAGDIPLTVIPVRLLDEESPEREENAASYKEYTITVEGGEGGLTVQIGGAGYYKLTALAGRENTISFRAIPEYLSVTFNLSQLEQEVVLTKRNGSILKILKVRQTGFDTLVGSSGGEDHLTGHHNTKFYLSPGGGHVTSGSGKNWYNIPDLTRNLYFTLSSNSTEHTSSLDMLLADFSPSNNLSLIKKPLGNIGLYISSYGNKTAPYIVNLKDGVSLQASKGGLNGSLFEVASVDQMLWQKKYPEEKGFVKYILSWLFNLKWPLSPQVTIFLQGGTAQYKTQQQELIYKPNPYSSVTVQASDSFNTQIKGNIGCSYVLFSSPRATAKALDILLSADKGSPQTIDLGYSMPTSIQGFLDPAVFVIRLQVSSAKSSFPLSIHWKEHSFPAQTSIKISPHLRFSLGNWLTTLQKDSGKWVTLYRDDMLLPERIEDVLSLNNTVTLMLHSNKTTHLLGVENRGDLDLKVLGELQFGRIKGAKPENAKWVHFYRLLSEFDITIPSHTIKYLAFQENLTEDKNILFYSELEKTSLKATNKPLTILPREKWSRYDEIQVFATTLNLENFLRYHIAEETPALSRQLMYAQQRVAIRNRDFLLKLFYIREQTGIGAIGLVFKNFFVESMQEILHKTLEREVKPLLAKNPNRLIDPSYRNHLELILGEEILNLAIIAQEYSSLQNIIELQKDPITHRLVYPQGKAAQPLAVYTYTFSKESLATSIHPSTKLAFLDPSMHEYRLPEITTLENSYYLDPVTRDLYLTKIITQPSQNRAFLIKFTKYKRHWLNFQKLVITGSHSELIASSGTALTFVGPELRHLELDFPESLNGAIAKERVSSRASVVLPTNDQVVHYDPRTAKQHYSFINYMLWDLRDRIALSKRAKALDSYLLEVCMHLDLAHPKWSIPSEILQYATGYYRTILPSWVRNRISVGDWIKIKADSVKTLNFSLITTQNELFQPTAERGFYIYYSILKLAHYAKPRNMAGDMLLDVDKETTFIVRGIDESDYYKKRIYVVLDLATEEERKLRADKNVFIIPVGEKGKK